jgi:hypothetical protein
LLQGGEEIGPEGHQPLASERFEPLLLQEWLTALAMPERLVVVRRTHPQGQAAVHGGGRGLAGLIAQAGGAEQAPHMHGGDAVAAP